MYLSDIEIFGFKSFAQKTKLKFAPGLSAIVGPNGCGKTNIVDAIRWVLGEKKASILRSDVMENVIFNGTKDRKPLGIAEVTMTFENSKNILPTEFNEVQITRRLYRSGESEYLINKTICRLKDILDLFMDTGIGSDSYSVIELKMVDAILSGKIDDRRAMFEEAAGIKKYKLRRKETTKKLELIKQDMQRLGDILLEVRKNVNSLSRQAAKTKRYNQLLAELRELEIALLSFEYSKYNKEFEDTNSKINNFENDKSKIDEEINLSNQNIHKLKEQLSEFENEFITSSDKEKFLLNTVNENKQKIAVSAEKIKSYENSNELIIREIQEAESQIEEFSKIIDNSKDSLTNKQSELDLIKTKKQDSKSISDNSETDLKIQRNVLNESKSIINSIKYKIESIGNTITKNNDKIKNTERKLQQNEEERYNLSKQSDNLDDDLKTEQEKLSGFEEEISELETELIKAQEYQKTIDSKIDNIKISVNDKKAILSSKKASLEFLKSLADNSDVSKFLNNDNNWKIEGEKILLGEAIGIDDEFQNAVLAALGDSAHSFIVGSEREAYSAIESLKKSSKGKSGFILLDKVPELAPPEDITINDKVFGWLSEIARVDDKIRNILRGLLGKTAIAADRETAANLLENKICETVVTLDGELFSNIGYIYSGSVSKKEGMWVGKKERIDKIKGEINSITDKINELTEELNNLTEERNQIDINSINLNLKNTRVQLANLVKKIDQMELKKTSIENNIQMLEDLQYRLQDELSELINDTDQLKEQISNLNIDLSGKINEAELHQQKLNEIENIHNVNLNDLKQLEIKEIAIKTEIKNIQSEIDKNLRLNNQTLEKIKSKKIELDQADMKKQELNEIINILTKELEGNEIEYQQSQNKRQFLAEKINSLKELFNEEERVNIDLRDKLDKIKIQLHNLEIQKTQSGSHIESIIEKLSEQYQIKSDEIDTIEHQIEDIQQSKIVISDIKDKLNQLGSVNFMALEEYESQSERLDFYEKQMADLEESEKILVETISEINTTAERNFKDTFDKIQMNFRMLFVKLFGVDGSADITLENDNLLESDIVITAKPPNKRPHSIEMLSGGEKTLTAIALLFAIYLVKPSPFCILDEVDAPLDDSNIEKYINLIKDFSIETQFLIVTHNKKTMEAADTLYGVTMQEDGVSKVVAVKLNTSAA